MAPLANKSARDWLLLDSEILMQRNGELADNAAKGVDDHTPQGK
jgi:hypothetical protein